MVSLHLNLVVTEVSRAGGRSWLGRSSVILLLKIISVIIQFSGLNFNFNSNFSSQTISNSNLILITRKISNFYFNSKIITNSNSNPYYEL